MNNLVLNNDNGLFKINEFDLMSFKSIKNKWYDILNILYKFK